MDIEKIIKKYDRKVYGIKILVVIYGWILEKLEKKSPRFAARKVQLFREALSQLESCFSLNSEFTKINALRSELDKNSDLWTNLNLASKKGTSYDKALYNSNIYQANMSKYEVALKEMDFQLEVKEADYEKYLAHLKDSAICSLKIFNPSNNADEEKKLTTTLDKFITEAKERFQEKLKHYKTYS